MRSTVINFLFKSGFFEITRRLLVSRGRFVLEFHGVVPERFPQIPEAAQSSLTAAELKKILTWAGNRFSFLTPKSFMKGKESGVLVTFDDGLANTFRYGLSILEQLDIPAIFFVSTQHVKNPSDWLPASRKLHKLFFDSAKNDALANILFDGMTIEQLQACGCHPLITVGAHTITHPFLTRCDDAQIEAELVGSRGFLQKITGQPVNYFAYPAGDYDLRVAKAVRKVGFLAAFAEANKHVGMAAYEIPRIGIYRSDACYLSAKLSGLHKSPIKEVYL